MRLLITDLTEMHGGNYCVAGWDLQNHCMVRPLPNGANWTSPLLQQHQVTPGVTLDVQPTGRGNNGSYPHQTEDTSINQHNIQLVSLGPTNWFGPNAPGTSASLDAAFGGALSHNKLWNGAHQGVHVAPGTRTNSLGSIVVPRANLQLFENFGKLKAQLNDGVRIYDLAVSSLALKIAWRQSGLRGAVASLPATRNYHVRVGLARAWGAPPKCYAMLNGVHG